MEGNNLIKKGVVVAVVLLFISVSVIPSTGNIVSFDDTTPPNTTHVFDPFYPDGENGWYVSDVGVTLIAIDDWSGVNATYYRLDGGLWMTYTEQLTVKSDGEHVIEYYSVDNAGNIEDVKSADFKIDQTSPEMLSYYKGGGNQLKFLAIVSDKMSEINRVEFYVDDELILTDYTEPYKWSWNWSEFHGLYIIAYDNAGNWDFDWPEPCPNWNVMGLILNPAVSENNVTFFAVVVHWLYDEYPLPESHIYKFKRLTFPNNYEGYIGRFFILATFYKYRI